MYVFSDLFFLQCVSCLNVTCMLACYIQFQFLDVFKLWLSLMCPEDIFYENDAHICYVRDNVRVSFMCVVHVFIHFFFIIYSTWLRDNTRVFFMCVVHVFTHVFYHILNIATHCLICTSRTLAKIVWKLHWNIKEVNCVQSVKKQIFSIICFHLS